MIKLINLHLYKKDIKMTYTLKLIDFKTKSYETTFGTCDLCMSTGMHTTEHFIFETSEDKVIYMENGFWDWGDYFTLIEVENSADFAHWLSQQEFEGEAPQDERDLQREISNIAEKYISCKEGELYERLGYSMCNIELSIIMNFYEELHQDEPIEDDYLFTLLDVEGVGDVEGDGYINSFWNKNKDSKEYNHSIDLYGEGFAAKNTHVLFVAMKELCNKSLSYVESNNGKVDEIAIWWENKGEENSLILEEKDIEKLHHCENDNDVYDFLIKKVK